MKMNMLCRSLLASVLLVAAACGGDPYMDGPYYPYPGGNVPGGNGGGGNGGGGNGGSGGGGNNGGGGSTTPTINFSVNQFWSVSYNGRENYEGAEVDRIVVKSTDSNSYYIDVISKASFDQDFNGSVADYADAVATNLAADVKDGYSQWADLLGTGQSYILFDRLRAGEWKAFAIGFDKNGKLTGKYAVLDFVIAEEKPTAEFNNWLGTWKIGGYDLKGNKISYTITLSSSEANYAYWLSGWEPAQNENEYDYDFEVYFNPENSRLEFNSLYFETLTYDDGDYEVCLNGNYEYNGQYYYINEDIGVADGFIAEDGKSAQVLGCNLTVEMQGGMTYETKFTSMQIMEVPVDPNGTTYVRNENVPQFPLEMEWISASTKAETKAASSVKLSAPRKAVRHGATKVVRKTGLNPMITR